MSGGQEIKYKENTKYFGMILDHQLTWGKHITEVNKKIVKHTGIFSKVRHLIPEEPRLTLYDSFVFSRLNYGIEVYANTEVKFLKRIKTSQNKILRILQFRHQRSPTNDLYTNFKILNLGEMHKMKLLSVIFKFVHNPDEFREALKALFTQHFQVVHGYNTRNKNYLHATHCHKKSYGYRKIPYRARQHWNSLLPSLKNEKSFTKFKASVKKYYLVNTNINIFKTTNTALCTTISLMKLIITRSQYLFLFPVRFVSSVCVYNIYFSLYMF